MNCVQVKCRKCRKLLLEGCKGALVDAHSSTDSQSSHAKCESVREKTVFYVNEENFPAWVLQAVEESNWTRGRLNCPQCCARVGSFDFISGSKCACQEHLLPVAHFIKSKVDNATS